MLGLCLWWISFFLLSAEPLGPNSLLMSDPAHARFGTCVWSVWVGESAISNRGVATLFFLEDAGPRFRRPFSVGDAGARAGSDV